MAGSTYLFEVGGGQTYKSFSLAVAAVWADWGTDAFDAIVEIRGHAGTYDEEVSSPGGKLGTTARWPLKIAANGSDQVTIQQAGGQCWNITQSQAEHIWFKSIDAEGQIQFYYNDIVLVEDCEWDATGGDFGRIIGPAGWLAKDCVFTVNYYHQPLGFDGNIAWERVKLVDEVDHGNPNALFGSKNIFYLLACVFIGDPQDARRELCSRFPGYASASEVFNCLFYKWLEGFYNIALSGILYGLRIQNNIFSDITGDALRVTQPEANVQAFSDSIADYMTLEANCFHSCGGILTDIDGTQHTTLAGIRGIGLDTLQKSLTSDPLLEADGSLGAGSPCINAGVGAGVILDVEGTTAPDPYRPAMGAYFDRDTTPAVEGGADIELVVTPTLGITGTSLAVTGGVTWRGADKSGVTVLLQRISEGGFGDTTTLLDTSGDFVKDTQKTWTTLNGDTPITTSLSSNPTVSIKATITDGDGYVYTSRVYVSKKVGSPDLDLRLQSSGVDRGQFEPGDTVTVVGGVTARQNGMTAVSTKVELYDSSDVLQSTLIADTNEDYTKDSQKTWATIAGGPVTFTCPSAANGYYVLATVEDDDGNVYAQEQTFDSVAAAEQPDTPGISSVTATSTGTTTATVTGGDTDTLEVFWVTTDGLLKGTLGSRSGPGDITGAEDLTLGYDYRFYVVAERDSCRSDPVWAEEN